MIQGDDAMPRKTPDPLRYARERGMSLAEVVNPVSGGSACGAWATALEWRESLEVCQEKIERSLCKPREVPTVTKYPKEGSQSGAERQQWRGSLGGV
jgi:hypothetical protein